MINNEKIGVGIVTCGRPELFKKLALSLKNCDDVDYITAFQDTIEPNPEAENYICGLDKWEWWDRDDETLSLSMIIANENVGVGEAKNTCLRSLKNQGCDHIFIIEDDIFIKDPSVFEKYIKASKASGIQHFNFSQHGIMNKTFDQLKTPCPRWTVNYGEESVVLYLHCVGAFSYYSRECLETVGLIDERYHNACEHVDHTFEVIKAGMHPPFWWFADIANSWEYLGDEEWSIEKSTISSNPKHKQMMEDADKIFVEKHGHLPVQTVDSSFEQVGQKLKQIKTQYEVR